MRKFMTMVTGSAVALSALVSSANGVAGADFFGKTGADDEYLVHIQGYAASTDKNNTRSVVAALPATLNDQTPTVKIRVYGNGQQLSCWLFSRDISTGSLSSSNTSTSVSGQTTLNLSLSLPFGPNYAHSAECALPKQVGLASATVFGATIT